MTTSNAAQPVLITDDGHPYYAIRTEAGYVRDENQARARFASEVSANELQEKLRHQARIAPSAFSRKLNNTQEAVMRRFYAHPVAQGDK